MALPQRGMQPPARCPISIETNIPPFSMARCRRWMSRNIKKFGRLRIGVIIQGRQWRGRRPSATFLEAIIGIIAKNGAVMDWERVLAYVTGTVDQELLA